MVNENAKVIDINTKKPIVETATGNVPAIQVAPPPVIDTIEEVDRVTFSPEIVLLAMSQIANGVLSRTLPGSKKPEDLARDAKKIVFAMMKEITNETE